MYISFIYTYLFKGLKHIRLSDISFPAIFSKIINLQNVKQKRNWCNFRINFVSEIFQVEEVLIQCVIKQGSVFLCLYLFKKAALTFKTNRNLCAYRKKNRS